VLIRLCPILKESIRLLKCVNQALVYTDIILSLDGGRTEHPLTGLAPFLASSIVGTVIIQTSTWTRQRAYRKKPVGPSPATSHEEARTHVVPTFLRSPPEGYQCQTSIAIFLLCGQRIIPGPTRPPGQAHAHVHNGVHRPRKRSYGGSRREVGLGKKRKEAK